MIGRMDGEPSLGVRIKEARDRKGWTQQQLASALGVNKKTVNNWENDRVSAPRRSLALLEDVLGVSFRTPPARRTAAETDEERARMLDEFRRLGQELFGWNADAQQEPEEEPPQHARKRSSA